MEGSWGGRGRLGRRHDAPVEAGGQGFFGLRWCVPGGSAMLVRGVRVSAHGIHDQATALNVGVMARSTSKQLVVCVGNEGYPASLEKRKLRGRTPNRRVARNGDMPLAVHSFNGANRVVSEDSKKENDQNNQAGQSQTI